jgi:hypothetical protein
MWRPKLTGHAAIVRSINDAKDLIDSMNKSAPADKTTTDDDTMRELLVDLLKTYPRALSAVIASERPFVEIVSELSKKYRVVRRGEE